MTAPRTARERGRQELVRSIKRVAQAHLAEVGAPGLSLRAVARDLGLVSSALYRYFPSRDALLTALIIDAYDAVGQVAEVAGAQGGTAGKRWLGVCRQVRGWAREHPHQWALIYGSPVPGYAAPRDTVPAALRITSVMAQVVREAQSRGELPPPARPLPPASVMTPEALQIAGLDLAPGFEEVVERALLLEIGLIGAISYELFGHLTGAVTDADRWFDRAMALVAEPVGLHLPLGDRQL